MRIFNITNADYSEGAERGFIITNLNAISASIKSIISQVRANKASSTKEIEDLKNRVTALENP